MARHHDKLIRDAQQVAAQVGAPAPRTEPRTRAEVESFVKGFGLSAAATRRIVEEWMADVRRARSAGYDAGYEDGTDVGY